MDSGKRTLRTETGPDDFRARSRAPAGSHQGLRDPGCAPGRQLREYLAMTRVRGTPAAERLAGQFAERGHQLGLLAQPLLVAVDDLLAGAITTDHVGVAPLRRPADVDVVTGALAVDDQRM